MTFDDAEKLLAHPRRWPKLTAPVLADLFEMACWLTALKEDRWIHDALDRLHALVLETLPPAARLRIVTDMGERLEALGREGTPCPVHVLTRALGTDPDFGVVSTAALTAAQLLGAEADGDGLAGPRQVLQLAVDATDASRQAAMVAGLAALGDERVFDLIDASWDSLAPEAQSDVLLNIGHHVPTVAAVDFLVSRLGREGEGQQEIPVGGVVFSLRELARTAARLGDRPYGASPGVHDVSRDFPSWASPAGTNTVNIRRTYTIEEIGARIGSRLNDAAAIETYPRLLPMALRAWGLEDLAFVNAVAAALASSGGRGAGARLLDSPILIEPRPDWNREDAVLEWGILNPMGPTKVQLCLVRADSESRALVYTLHNPFWPECLLLGVIEGDVGSQVRSMLSDLGECFESSGRMVLLGLPHWVRASEESGLQTALDGAVFFRTLHRAAIAQGMAIDDDVDALERELHALRDDPRQEVHRQFIAAMETAARDVLGRTVNSREAASRHAHGAARSAVVGAGDASYERWYTTASSPAHAAAVSSHFLDCWNAALRLQRTLAE